MHAINPDYQASVNDALVKLGSHIRRTRTEAFRESRGAFAKRIGCSPVTLDRMERGEPGVAIVYVLAALQASQTLDNVVEASNPKVLIATLMPIQFPTDFAAPSR